MLKSQRGGATSAKKSVVSSQRTSVQAAAIKQSKIDNYFIRKQLDKLGFENYDNFEKIKPQIRGLGFATPGVDALKSKESLLEFK